MDQIEWAVITWNPVSKYLPKEDGYYLCVRKVEDNDEFVEPLCYDKQNGIFYDVFCARAQGKGAHRVIRDDVLYWGEFPKTPSQIKAERS